MTDILPGTERPGGAVEAEYRKALKSWRRRMRRYFWPMLGIGATLLLAGLLTPHRVWAWVFTSMGAFWLGMFALARDLPPTPIRNLGQGAEGERDTAKELRRLTSGWTVRHDLNGRYGNLDHVLLGPAGVFILETKAWWGQTLTVSAAGPALRGRDSDWRGRRECDLAKTMKIRAARTNQALRELVRISLGSHRSSWSGSISLKAPPSMTASGSCTARGCVPGWRIDPTGCRSSTWRSWPASSEPAAEQSEQHRHRAQPVSKSHRGIRPEQGGQPGTSRRSRVVDSA